MYYLSHVVLDIDVDGLLVIAAGGVIKAEREALQRIAVVGKKYRSVVHPQLSLTVGLEIADRVAGVGILPFTHQSTTYLGGFADTDTLGYGHRFQREAVRLLNIQILVAGCEQSECGHRRKK